MATELEERIDKCQKLLDVDPNSQIFAALAEAHRCKGDLEKAFRICQAGLRTHPSYGTAHVVMAKINLDRGLYDWAEAEVKKAIEIEGNGRAIELLLAEIYIYKGEFNAAVKLLRKLHQTDSKNEQIKKLLDIALKLPEEQAILMKSKTPPSFDTGNQSTRVSKSAVQAASQTLDIKDVLQAGVAIPDIEGGLFINVEGLVVESEWQVNLDPNVCSAALGDVDHFLNQALVRGAFGRVRTTLIETVEQVFYLLHVADGLFLFVGNSKINLGTLRMRIASLVDKYKAR